MQRIFFSLLFFAVFLSFPFRVSAQAPDDLRFWLWDGTGTGPVADSNADRTYLVFAPNYSEGYEPAPDGDSGKQSTYFDTWPAIWSILDADNSNLPMTQQGLPMVDCRKVRMGFSVPAPGTYIFMMVILAQTNLQSIVLVDNLTNIATNLLTNPDYTFSTTTGYSETVTNRFVLLVNYSSSCDASAVTLNVNNGLGGGTYPASSIVQITANAAPSGQVFDKWTGDVSGVTNVNDANTYITLGNTNATVTATYRNLPMPLPAPMLVSGNVHISGPVRSEESVHIFCGTNIGKIDIDSTDANTVLKTDTIVFYSDDTSDGLLMNLNKSGGVAGIMTASQPGKVIVRKTFTYNIYTYISLPFEVTPNSVLQEYTSIPLTRGVSGGTTGDYWVWGFDAQARSTNQGFITTSGVWKEMVPTDNFDMAMGYQFYYNGPEGEAVDFVTTDATAIKNLFAYSPKDINYTMYRTLNNNTTQEGMDAGWEFIGGLNSSVFTFAQANFGGNISGTIYYRDTKNSQATNNQMHNTYSDYVLGQDDGVIIANVGPYTPFYIQGNIQTVGSAQGTVTFNPTGLLLDDITFRSSKDDAGAQDQLYFALSSDKDSSFDRFYLNFNNNYSESYQVPEDAAKMSIAYDERPAVWSLLDGVNNSALVVSGLPMKDNREVQMGFSVPEAGNYTISLSPLKNQDVRNVILVDNTTGNKVDLLQEGSYSFNTSAVDDENGRFVLYINSSYTGTPTVNANDPYAYAKDNLLTVKNLTVGDKVQVLDLVGRTITTGTATGKEFSVVVDQKGVYVVDVKGEKTSVLKVLNK